MLPTKWRNECCSAHSSSQCYGQSANWRDNPKKGAGRRLKSAPRMEINTSICRICFTTGQVTKKKSFACQHIPCREHSPSHLARPGPYHGDAGAAFFAAFVLLITTLTVYDTTTAYKRFRARQRRMISQATSRALRPRRHGRPVQSSDLKAELSLKGKEAIAAR